MKRNIKRFFGFAIILNLLPLWCMVIANYDDSVPKEYIGMESLFGYACGWLGNIAIIGTLLIFLLVYKLIDE